MDLVYILIIALTVTFVNGDEVELRHQVDYGFYTESGCELAVRTAWKNEAEYELVRQYLKLADERVLIGKPALVNRFKREHDCVPSVRLSLE